MRAMADSFLEEFGLKSKTEQGVAEDRYSV